MKIVIIVGVTVRGGNDVDFIFRMIIFCGIIFKVLSLIFYQGEMDLKFFLGLFLVFEVDFVKVG